jgi:EmrB/QacA subfamily drug resistance transporter
MTGQTVAIGDRTTARHLGIALAVISTAQLMFLLDASIVNVALPSIQRGLHFSASNLVWVTTAYSLAFGGLLLFGGRVGDLFGRRRMFFIGIALFGVASLLGGLAQSDVWLIVTRAAQGASAAIASPAALSLIATNFPEGASRNRAMGVYAAMSGAGAAVGLLAGGLLTDLASWRWVLFVNVPIGLAVLVIGPRALRESQSTRGHLDLPGALTATLGAGLLVYGLTSAAIHSWSSVTTVASLVGAAVLVVVFITIEAFSADALLPTRILADRKRSSGYLMMLLIATGLFAVFFFLTQYVQDILGYSPLKAGLGFLPVVLAVGVASQGAARMVGRIGARPLLLVGPALIAGGLLWLSQLTVSSGYTAIVGPMLCVGFGMGASFVPLTLGAVSGVTSRDAGIASALLSTGQQVGGAIGLGLLSTVAVETMHSRARELAVTYGGHLRLPLMHQAVVHGYSRAFLVAGGIVAVAIAVSAAAVRRRGLEQLQVPERDLLSAAA